MRIVCIAIVAAAALASAAAAEDKSIPLPEITVGGDRPPSNDASSCNNGGSDQSHSLDCLNRKLREQVDRVNPSVPTAPLDAGSPDTKIGVVNIPAVKQQYGKNYGVSVMPYRPPPLIYSPALGRH